jgi:hypothetical protein
VQQVEGQRLMQSIGRHPPPGSSLLAPDVFDPYVYGDTTATTPLGCHSRGKEGTQQLVRVVPRDSTEPSRIQRSNHAKLRADMSHYSGSHVGKEAESVATMWLVQTGTRREQMHII